MVEALPAGDADRLRAAPFTYAPVGATPEPQAGFRNFTRQRTLTRRDFAGAAEDLMSWRVYERSGLHVRASDARAQPWSVVEMTLGVGTVGVKIPCRVVHVIEEPDRVGFAYGSLPGHPESGEESFVVERRPDGSLSFTITAFSRPATRLARLGGPLTTAVQAGMTRRYLRALDRG
ncbi:DUF1990 family protein [Aeromicrobium choanae]|uniref:Uncharacterized protein, UPF0548 family n=1 Tax=Aeromicrobium choanae TaxID=1736691 RepID=A0A1T4Z0I7_9ACTN|nr:DUF1990 domain-containing protein [Aeromicrobium choanae]SKB07532.1 Uncharacterized protein, UPF0548 family [Aeromicrobium choanae]